MRFMIIVKATNDSEAGVMPEEALFERMSRFHEQLAAAGLLIDASGLKPTAHGWRIRYEGDATTVVDGPFTETKELIAGYTIIQAASREEAPFSEPCGRRRRGRDRGSPVLRTRGLRPEQGDRPVPRAAEGLHDCA